MTPITDAIVERLRGRAISAEYPDDLVDVMRRLAVLAREQEESLAKLSGSVAVLGDEPRVGERRIGQFHVDSRLIDGLQVGQGANLFHRMVVLRVEHDHYRDRACYFAWHPDFEIIGRGQFLPEYEPVFDSESAIPRWQKVRVTWVKKYGTA